jgi:CheY-like chemotaxis protein
MQRNANRLTQPLMPINADSQPGEAFPGLLPSSETNFGAEFYRRAPLSHVMVSKWIEPSVEVSVGRVGRGNGNWLAALAWPIDLFGPADLTPGDTRRRDDPSVMDGGDVAAWLSELGSLIRLAPPDKLMVFVEPRAGIWPVAIDRHRLSAVLFALLMSARDAMAAVGTVSISARNMVADEACMDGIPAGDNVVISVSSNRDGMSGERLVRVADSFFEAVGSDEWVGGAITMAGAFLEACGGAIVVRSVLETITAVEVILPRAGMDRDLPRPDLDRRVARTRNITVLVVDDDESAREVAVEYLEELGYSVISTASAQLAYNTVRTSPDIDIVVSDVVMPDIDGVTLAGMLRSFKPELPVVFMTGYPRDFSLLGELVLAKPFTFKDLAGLVARGLGRGGDAH